MKKRCLSILSRTACAALVALALANTRLGATELFMTHHSPMGSWSSLTLGLPGAGVGIDMEGLGIQNAGDLVIACSRGPGKTIALPFFTPNKTDDYEGKAAGNAAPKTFLEWRTVPVGELVRTLTPATDEFAGGGIRFRIISPRAPFPASLKGKEMALATLPALLLEVEIDNSEHDVPATGFLGLSFRAAGRMRALDWADDGLVGVAYQDRWALAAMRNPEVYTIRVGSIAPMVQNGTGVIHPGGNEGGIAFRVAPRSKGTLTATFAFYRVGTDVAQGLPASYAYTAHHGSVEKVARAALGAADRLKESARLFNERVTPKGADPLAVELLAQASQGYYANASLLRDSKGALHWSVCEGGFGWRNTLDLAADHLLFELAAHPWVAGNVIDRFIDRYSYRDKVRFEGETEARHPGGLSFTHDQGNYTAYSPQGWSGYEQPNREGVYSFMTTEQLLNGAFCAGAYAIKGGDDAWRKRRLPIARGLIASMENREHHDPALRDGILRAQSDRVGTGKEITTYDALDHALVNSRGSVYIVVKTWAAALMLERWFNLENDKTHAARANALASRAAKTLVDKFDAVRGVLPANLLDGGESLVAAAIDPLAVPLFCGLGENMRKYPELLERLRTHGRTCMEPGKCIDAKSGGLRLSSTSANTWPSKVALTLAGVGWLEGRRVKELAPTAYAQLASWMQVSANRLTLCDQIDATTGKTIGGVYYPRMVTVQALLEQPLWP